MTGTGPSVLAGASSLIAFILSVLLWLCVLGMECWRSWDRANNGES